MYYHNIIIIKTFPEKPYINYHGIVQTDSQIDNIDKERSCSIISREGEV